ncbi:hypothetical protein [Streptomyces sp. NPDC059894]|uniref:hypothetical protein n=1 Tax=unclassified Streptomyces TaxID=2593676 RepID=UPI0036565146
MPSAGTGRRPRRRRPGRARVRIVVAPLLVVEGQDLRTLQVGLPNFTGDFGATQYGPLSAAIRIDVFGTLVLHLFLDRKVMKGLTSGAVKG